MPKPRIDYAAIRRFILVMMYDAFAEDKRMDFSVARVRQRLPMPANLAKVSLDQLEDDGLIEELTQRRTRPAGILGGTPTQEWVGTGAYELTEDGRKAVENIPDEVYDMALVALANGTAANAFQPSSAAPIPLAPDAWEPLPIDVGDPELAEVRSALAEVVDLVAADNGYAAEHPNERAEVLSGLTAASTLFREASIVGYSALATYVIWPLERLLARFTATTVVGAAGVLLRDALIQWAKSKTGVILDDIFKLGK